MIKDVDLQETQKVVALWDAAAESDEDEEPDNEFCMEREEL